MGNIDVLRDWGHAQGFARMQWMMLQQDQADDYVIATGEQHSARDFILWTAEELGLRLRFDGHGKAELAVLEAVTSDAAPAVKAGQVVMRIDPRYLRPAEVNTLLGDPSKAKARLGWTPTITARQMCAEMVATDLDQARRLRLLRDNGFYTPISREN